MNQALFCLGHSIPNRRFSVYRQLPCTPFCRGVSRSKAACFTKNVIKLRETPRLLRETLCHLSSGTYDLFSLIRSSTFTGHLFILFRSFQHHFRKLPPENSLQFLHRATEKQLVYEQIIPADFFIRIDETDAPRVNFLPAVLRLYEAF